MQDSRWSRKKKEEEARKRETRQRRGCRCRILREGEREQEKGGLGCWCWMLQRKKKQIQDRGRIGVTVFERLDSDKRRLGARTGDLEGGQLQAKQRYQVLSAPAIDARRPQVTVTLSGCPGQGSRAAQPPRQRGET